MPSPAAPASGYPGLGGGGPALLPLSPQLAFRFSSYWQIVAHRRNQKPDVRFPFTKLKTEGVWTPLDARGEPMFPLPAGEGSADAHRAYWLLHYSGHSKARDVMMQLHWEMQNHFQHFGRPGLGMLGFDPRRRVEDLQLTLPYEFDPSAAALTRQTLLEQIPRRIGHHGIKFADFFGAVVNETTATKDMLASAIGSLSRDKELEIWSSDGRRRHNGVQIADDDIIRRSQQRILFIP